MPSKGGAVLGEGGQGRVSTISDLPDAVSRCPYVTLVTVDLKEAKPRRTRVSTDQVVRRIAPFAAFKADIERPSSPTARSDAKSEFDLTTRLVCDLARAALGELHQDGGGRDSGASASPAHGRDSDEEDRRSKSKIKIKSRTSNSNSKSSVMATAAAISRVRKRPALEGSSSGSGKYDERLRRLATDLRKLTALMVLRGRIVIIGVIADACLSSKTPTADSVPTYHPMLRRMEASLRDLSKRQPGGLTLTQLTDAVVATLEGMRLLDRCGARHGDVKEHNVLYDRGPDGRVKSYALCDFGFLRFPSDRLTPEGTEGSTSPLLFRQHQRDEFVSEFILTRPEFGEARDIWESYEKGGARQRSIAEQSLKNDLYAVGVMLGHVRVQNGELPPPLQQVVHGLLFGGRDRASIWTLRQAQSTVRAAIAAARAAGAFEQRPPSLSSFSSDSTATALPSLASPTDTTATATATATDAPPHHSSS